MGLVPVGWSLRLHGEMAETEESSGVGGSVSAARLHGLACALVETPDSEHAGQVKPFSVAVPPACPRGEGMRIGWLDDTRLPDAEAWPGRRVWLGAAPVTVGAVERDAVSYADLADAAPASRVRVEFHTPTYVNRAGRQIPLPEPELLLGGLLRRWQHFSPVPVAEATATALLERVHIAQHRVRTVAVPMRGGGRAGFVGHAVFGVPSKADTVVKRLFAGLWRFAEYAGVGAQTTHGLGHVTVATR
ncbi:CRISPR system precrRNA processing endoribonuclease RAMP protein Cas6 [Salinactinospora qingdaonensis]|uniref:CRISPR-associated protein Cas6 C-terminal domain-containing protein n=1 Tax=Salinactinospora qingdaonensis TaxID=702744 RepID=A0ABP7F679_9ACTN